MYFSLLTPADLLLRDQFETRTLPDGGFRHREHVRLTWIYLTMEPPDAAGERLCRSLLDLVTRDGAAHKFHRTLTIAWVRIIAAARREYPERAFEALVEACPILLDKDTPLSYYSHDRLYSDQARHEFVEPDLRPLPGV